jgi:hypothetical protein
MMPANNLSGVVDANEQLFVGAVDTGDKHKVANIFANFRKYSEPL